MDEAAKQAIADQWAAIAQTNDFDTWVSFWDPDIRIVEPGMDMAGNDFIEFGKEFFGTGGRVISLDMESYDLFVHGDVAYQMGQFDEDFRPPGKDPVHVENHFFARWVKADDGSWRLNRFMAGPRAAPDAE